MKKVISVLVALLVLFTSMSVYATTPTVYSEGYLYYTVENGSVTIVGNFGSQAELTIPSSIGGYPVNKIAAGAFTGNANLKKITLPDTITEIEEGAVPSSGVTVEHTTDDTVTYVAENTTKSKQYTTLAAALQDAVANDTVKLIDNVDGELYITVNAGVTLDLAGKNITNANMLFSSGNVIDSTTGKTATRGYVSAVGYSFSTDNQTYCPVYDKANDGYFFLGVTFNTQIDNGTELIFNFKDNNPRKYLYTFMNESLDYESPLQASIKVSYKVTNSDKLSVNVSQNFDYDSIYMKTVVQSYGTEKVYAFSAKVNGITGEAKMVPQFIVRSKNGAVICSFSGPTFTKSASENVWTN